MERNNATAIITGASSGLGREFARQLAASGEVGELWLIARTRERLEETASELASRFSVSTRVMPMDLKNGPAPLQTALETLRPNVRWWINNAGFGRAGLFEDLPGDELAAVVELNCRALVACDSVVLPYLSRGAHVVHTASVAAFLPQPSFAVYAASKAFVLSYSRALSAEWRPKGITATAVCPGPMETGFFDATEKTLASSIKKIGIEKPEKVVRVALRRARRGKDISISGLSGKAIRLASRLLPHPWILRVERSVLKL